MPNRFPSKDADFNNYLQRAVPYIDANAARLNVSADNQKEMNNKFKDWNTLYPKSTNPDERTTTITKEKNKLRKAMEKLLRTIFDDIPQSALTAKDREVLNLKERDAEPTPVPVLGYAPSVMIEARDYLKFVLKITDPQNPETQAMPAGQKAQVQVGIKEEGSASSKIIWDAELSYITGKFLSEVSFPLEMQGKRVYIRARYVNTRNEGGDWSEPLSAMVA